MSEELKACPFDGGQARAYDVRSLSGFEVSCQSCGASLWHARSKSDAIAAWNRRSSPPQNDAGGHWICDGIPDAVIEAGIDAWESARQEMQDREQSDQPEAYRDWDDGMIVAAIFKAMSAALRTPMSALQALGQEFEAGWQPIETAPKDGKNVLLLIGETIPDLPDVRVGCYLTMQDVHNVGYPDAGWLVWNDCHDYFVTDRATHWMPLPSSPSGEG